MIPLNDDTKEILGRPNFTCIRIAEVLRQRGDEIPRKAEAEQAAVIHFLLGLYETHGADWRKEGDRVLADIVKSSVVKS